MDHANKRKEPPTTASNDDKKAKKQWRVAHKFQKHQGTIEPGDAGIWATCVRGKEGKSTLDLRDVFMQYASDLYPELHAAQTQKEDGLEVGNEAEDIEASVSAEVSAIKAPELKHEGGETPPLFQAVKLDTQCILFFKTHPTIQCTSFVERICQDKASGASIRGCRFIKRLTPMTRMAKSTVNGLRDVCDAVLVEATLGSKHAGVKYAIRPTIREHSILKRDEIIQQVATAVGDGYGVDLKKPDVVVLVEVYRNILGMAIVNGPEFERLKRFNLAEIGPATEGGAAREDASESTAG